MLNKYIIQSLEMYSGKILLGSKDNGRKPVFKYRQSMKHNSCTKKAWGLRVFISKK